MSYQSEVLADSPVLFLTLNETVGSFADLSVSGLSGAANGALTRGTATGHAGLGAGVTFGGVGTVFVSVADTPILDLTGDFTYECWLIYQTFAASQYLMSKGQDASGTTAGYGMYLSTTPSVSVDRVNLTAGYRPGTGPASGAWHHLVVTRIVNQWTQYVDGSQTNTGSVAQSVDATARDFCIGATYTSGGQGGSPCNATTSMSNVAVYSAGLSAARVAAHFNARDTGSGGGSPRKSPPTPFVATIAANLPPGLGGTPPGLGGEPPGQAKKQSPQSPAARRRHLFGGDPRRRKRP